MNGQTQNKIRAIIFLVVVIIGAFLIISFIVRVGMIIPDLSYEEAYKLEYGEGWAYDDNSIFGKTCIKVDYKNAKVLDTKIIGWKIETIKKNYCNSPRFFEFSRWDNGCPNIK